MAKQEYFIKSNPYAKCLRLDFEYLTDAHAYAEIGAIDIDRVLKKALIKGRATWPIGFLT